MSSVNVANDHLSSLNQPKNRDKEGFKDDEREKEPAMLQKQPSKEKSDLGDKETEVELEGQIKVRSRGKRYCNVDMSHLKRGQAIANERTTAQTTRQLKLILIIRKINTNSLTLIKLTLAP